MERGEAEQNGSTTGQVQDTNGNGHEAQEKIIEYTLRDTSRIKMVLTMLLDLTYQQRTSFFCYLCDLIYWLIVRFGFTQNEQISKERFCNCVANIIKIPIDKAKTLIILEEELDPAIKEMGELSLQLGLSFENEPTYPKEFYFQ
ncbi:hypothetical protein RF11_02241 [Thelohanellus kitauei]|uniref:Uncharacterized protein n=1 Tax=Thelohanellus kitauei TaxID=669202 RepID=A0A0C2J2X6_THEKT|nr:hypothetical protein RF11_02241 [Thelohanellus kitauei]